MADEKRVDKYKKDTLQEHVLSVMNRTLESKELELISGFSEPELPIVFIVGAQRSGTTLLMQLIAKYFEVSYPNNFIARYWNVPFIGATLFQSLKGNLIDSGENDLSSDLGYTKGLNGPHEFGYFWKKWFPWESWEEKRYDQIDYSILKKQLAAWQSIEQKPLVFKNLVQVNFNIEKLADIFPNSYFIHIIRKPEYVVQSSYMSRTQLYGKETSWFGPKPPQYVDIFKLPAVEQIYAQVHFSVREIREQLHKCKAKFTELRYEELVKDPVGLLGNIRMEIGHMRENVILPELKDTNVKKLSQDFFKEIEELSYKYA